VEAMSLGKPVIASNGGGPTETVSDGVTGFLCEDTPASFGAAMKTLIQDENLASLMGTRGVDRVEMFFGFEAFKRKLNQLVVQIMN
jgi:alpha-1,3/alpha-1,6-mannosyltransferase